MTTSGSASLAYRSPFAEDGDSEGAQSPHNTLQITSIPDALALEPLTSYRQPGAGSDGAVAPIPPLLSYKPPADNTASKITKALLDIKEPTSKAWQNIVSERPLPYASFKDQVLPTVKDLLREVPYLTSIEFAAIIEKLQSEQNEFPRTVYNDIITKLYPKLQEWSVHLRLATYNASSMIIPSWVQSANVSRRGLNREALDASESKKTIYEAMRHSLKLLGYLEEGTEDENWKVYEKEVDLKFSDVADFLYEMALEINTRQRNIGDESDDSVSEAQQENEMKRIRRMYRQRGDIYDILGLDREHLDSFDASEEEDLQGLIKQAHDSLLFVHPDKTPRRNPDGTLKDETTFKRDRDERSKFMQGNMD